MFLLRAALLVLCDCLQIGCLSAFSHVSFALDEYLAESENGHFIRFVCDGGVTTNNSSLIR